MFTVVARLISTDKPSPLLKHLPTTCAMVIAVLWIAAEDGRRWFLVAGAGAATAIMLPFLALGEVPGNAVDWLRGVLAPFVYAAIAAIINEMSRQRRVQLDKPHRCPEPRRCFDARQGRGGGNRPFFDPSARSSATSN
jgi:hypothetical protein